MTDPPRMLEGETDDFARSVLESSFLDEPPGKSLQATLAAVSAAGAATAATGTAGATAASTTAATASVTGGSAATTGATSAGAATGAAGSAVGTSALVSTAAGTVAKGVTVLALAKSVGIGVVAGLVVAGGATAVTPNRSAPAVQPSAERPSNAEAVESRGARPSARFGAPPVEVPPAPTSAPEAATAERAATGARSSEVSSSAARGGEAKRPDRGPRHTAPLTTDALRADVEQLDRARMAMRSGNPAAALRTLDAYDRSTRTGALDEDARVLRIEALIAAGRREQARALARSYIRRNPDDSHSVRWSQVLGLPRADETQPTRNGTNRGRTGP